jgi:chromosome segregation ATPase
MDPVVLAAIIAGGSGVLGGSAGGGMLGWALTRRQRHATVELTEEQAEQIRGQVWKQLNDDLRAEIIRLQSRVNDLEARLASLDLALREKAVELAATQAERDSLRVQLAVAQAQLEAREREIGDLKVLATNGSTPIRSGGSS